MPSKPSFIPRERPVRASSWVVSLALEDGGVAVDLSDGTISFVLEVGLPGVAPILTKTKGVSGEVSFPDGNDGVDGRVDFLFDETDTAELTAGVFVKMALYFSDSGTSPPTVRMLWAQGDAEPVDPPTGAPPADPTP